MPEFWAENNLDKSIIIIDARASNLGKSAHKIGLIAREILFVHSNRYPFLSRLLFLAVWRLQDIIWRYFTRLKFNFKFRIKVFLGKILCVKYYSFNLFQYLMCICILYV